MEVAILGVGGLGREAHEALEAAIAGGSGQRFAGFLDDDASRHAQSVHDAPVLGGSDWLRKEPGVHVCVAVGAPAVRARIVAGLQHQGHRRFASIVDPRAAIGRRVRVGEGAIVLQRASITTDVELGRHVVVNPGVTLAHDDRVEDHVTLAPGAAIAGRVLLREGCDVGINAAVFQGLEVGAWSIVGGGAVVRENVPRDTTVVGVPARVVKTRPRGWQTHL